MRESGDSSTESRLLHWFGEEFWIHARIKLDLRSFYRAGIFPVLLILMCGRKRNSVAGLPVFQIGLALYRPGSSGCLVSLAQHVSGRRIDKPSDRHVAAGYIDDARVDVPDFL